MHPAMRVARAITVSCGLTPSEVGRMLASQTKRSSTSQASPVGLTTDHSGSLPMRQVPMG